MRLLWIILLLVLVVPAQAQDSVLSCAGGRDILDFWTLGKIATPQDEPLIIQVTGSPGLMPLVYRSDANGTDECIGLESAGTLSGVFNDALFDAPSLMTSQLVNTVPLFIGGEGYTTGEFLVTLRGSGNADYTLLLSGAILRSGVPLRLYAYGVDGAQVGLAMLDFTGQGVQPTEILCNAQARDGCDPTLAGSNVTFDDLTTTAQPTDAALAIDTAALTDDSLAFRVESDGAYVLALRVANAVPQAVLPLPIITFTEADGYTLSCADAEPLPAVQLAFSATLPPLPVTGLSATALTMASRRACASSDAPLAALNLPNAQFPPLDTTRQVSIGSTNDRAFIGWAGDETLALLIEDITMPSVLEVTLPYSGLNATASLTATLISADGILDPALQVADATGATLLDADGQGFACDNAGVPGECYGTTEPLRGYDVTLADGRILLLDTPDAQVTVPLTPDLSPVLTLYLNATNGSEGRAVLVLVLNP